MDRTTLILLSVPLALVQVGLMILALVDIVRPERQVRGGNKVIWILVIVLVNLIGPLVYLFFGRREAESDAGLA